MANVPILSATDIVTFPLNAAMPVGIPGDPANYYTTGLELQTALVTLAKTTAALGLSALSTGIVKVTTSTGALTTAIAADFPTLNQNTTGNALTATTAGTASSVPGSGITGNISVANLNSGTNANINSFWRGDAAWANKVVQNFSALGISQGALANPTTIVPANNVGSGFRTVQVSLYSAGGLIGIGVNIEIKGGTSGTTFATFPVASLTAGVSLTFPPTSGGGTAGGSVNGDWINDALVAQATGVVTGAGTLDVTATVVT